MKRLIVFFTLIVVVLSGCIPQAAQAVIPVTAIDRCAPENIKTEIQKLTTFQRDFDDVSFLAQSTPQNQTAVVILELQRFRREALDYDAPVCLKTLKENQVQYMTSVVSTLMSFMSGGEADAVNQQLAMTREMRMQYDAELARLMGVKYETPTPYPTRPPSTATPAIEPTPIVLPVTTEQDINVFQGPGIQYSVQGNFLRGQNAYAFARTENNEWVLVQLVEKTEIQGWVAVRLVKVEGDIAILPLFEPQ